jgi:hypothetical protein
MNEYETRDSVGAPTVAEELEAEARAQRNECVCGTIDCKTEYACITSGY